MAKSKLIKVGQKVSDTVAEGYKKIEDTVVGGYKKVENAAVSGYKKVEDTFVGGYKKVEDAFVDQFLTHDGETVEEAKERLSRQKTENAEHNQKN